MASNLFKKMRAAENPKDEKVAPCPIARAIQFSIFATGEAL
jgi:hypothetical protein